MWKAFGPKYCGVEGHGNGVAAAGTLGGKTYVGIACGSHDPVPQRRRTFLLFSVFSSLRRRRTPRNTQLFQAPGTREERRIVTAYVPHIFLMLAAVHWNDGIVDT